MARTPRTKCRAHSDVHGDKCSASALEWNHNIIDFGPTEDHIQQLNGIGIEQRVQLGTNGEEIVFVVRIGAQQRE